MKIAIVSQQGMVSSHFGKSDAIICFNEHGKQLKKIEKIKHEHEGIPHLIIDEGVDVVICEQLGQKAKTRFDALNIKVVTGAKGKVLDVIDLYINNQLKVKDNICKGHHEHDA